MLRIIIHLGQGELVPQLKALFPDLSLEKLIDGDMHCLACLREGREGMRQITFLHTHDIEYVDVERQREQSIRAFFDGVELEGKPITMLRFRPLPHERYWHVATITTEDDEFNLRFPPNWNPGMNGL